MMLKTTVLFTLAATLALASTNAPFRRGGSSRHDGERPAVFADGSFTIPPAVHNTNLDEMANPRVNPLSSSSGRSGYGSGYRTKVSSYKRKKLPSAYKPKKACKEEREAECETRRRPAKKTCETKCTEDCNTPKCRKTCKDTCAAKGKKECNKKQCPKERRSYARKPVKRGYYANDSVTESSRYSAPTSTSYSTSSTSSSSDSSTSSTSTSSTSSTSTSSSSTSSSSSDPKHKKHGRNRKYRSRRNRRTRKGKCSRKGCPVKH